MGNIGNRSKEKGASFSKEKRGVRTNSPLRSSFNVTTCKDYESAALPTELGWRIRAGINEQYGNVNCAALCSPPSVDARVLVRLEQGRILH